MKLSISTVALQKMKDGTWIPPIKKFDADLDNERKDWHDRYEELSEHHEKETKILLAVIQELATKLIDNTK